jgi:hypothetical protein
MHACVEGKIAIYGSLAFFTLAMIQAAVSAALVPNFKLPSGIRYKVPSQLMKLPCRNNGEVFLYGYNILVIVPGDPNDEWATICRDILGGGWRWHFQIDEPSR